VSARGILRLLAIVALLAASAVTLAACGSSAGGLIPTANSTPLQADFEAVAHAAVAGEGNCGETSAAIEKTELDFQRLPSSVDQALHSQLEHGIENLRSRAMALCAQPLSSSATATATSTRSSETTSTTTQTTTSSESTQSIPTVTSTSTTTAGGGGTPVPEETPPVPGTGRGGGTGAGEVPPSEDNGVPGRGPGSEGPPGQREGNQ
jgi:uncharacterized low-complexity protein